MKRLTFYFLFITLSLSFFKETFSQTVYITKTGKKYHSENCIYLKKSSIQIDIKDAIDRGNNACSRCNPPELSDKEATVKETSSTVSKSSSKSEMSSGRCQATTKNGTQCKRNARSGSKYCWQHGG